MPEVASRTAEYVALFRAIESARPARLRRFNDPFAVGFLEPKLRLVARASRLPGLRSLIPRVIDSRWPHTRSPVVVRTTVIDDAVEAGLEGGAEQLVILGAGYDSRAMRVAGAPSVPVFELDQPATQERKKRCLLKSAGSLPQNVTYVPFDLEEEGVGAPLARAGLVSGRPGVFVWEGVLSYLTEEAIDSTLRWVAETGAPGSRLIFTYIDISRFGPGGSAGEDIPWKDAVARAGEPFRYGLDPATVSGFLSGRGLKLVWDTSTAEALENGPRDPITPTAPDFYRVAMAEVDR